MFFHKSLDKSPDNLPNLNTLRPRILQVLRKGSISALERGPRVGGQVVETQIRLHNATIGRGTADSFVMATAAQCVQKVTKIVLFLATRLHFVYKLTATEHEWHQAVGTHYGPSNCGA